MPSHKDFRALIKKLASLIEARSKQPCDIKALERAVFDALGVYYGQRQWDEFFLNTRRDFQRLRRHSAESLRS
jgi:hypothetical protein